MNREHVPPNGSRSRRLRLSGRLLAVGVLAAVGTAPTIGASGAVSAGGATAPELVGSLQAVSGSSPADAWGVGSRWTGAETKTLIEHWDGSNWTKVPSPSPGGANGSFLSGVSVVSASNAWAVGNYFVNEDLSKVKTLILHWNGTRWARVPSPSPVGFVNLVEVSAASADDVWAVGLHRTATNTQNLVVHWDGTSWERVVNRLPGGPEQLYGVSAVSAHDVWAVGYHDDGTQDFEGLIEHWNGTKWKVVPSPSPGPTGGNLRGVSAVSADDAWVVGSYATRDGMKIKTLTEHWDGTSWSVVPSPSRSGDSTLWGVSVVSADDAWAVGSYDYGPDNFSKTLIEHWNGKTWTKVASPNPGGNDRLFGVSAVSANAAWVVGDTYDLSVWRTLNEDWDGTSWKAATAP